MPTPEHMGKCTKEDDSSPKRIIFFEPIQVDPKEVKISAKLLLNIVPSELRKLFKEIYNL